MNKQVNRSISSAPTTSSQQHVTITNTSTTQSSTNASQQGQSGKTTSSTFNTGHGESNPNRGDMSNYVTYNDDESLMFSSAYIKNIASQNGQVPTDNYLFSDECCRMINSALIERLRSIISNAVTHARVTRTSKINQNHITTAFKRQNEKLFSSAVDRIDQISFHQNDSKGSSYVGNLYMKKNNGENSERRSDQIKRIRLSAEEMGKIDYSTTTTKETTKRPTGQQTLVYGDRFIDLRRVRRKSKYLRQQMPKLCVHWLAIEGIQPTLYQNPKIVATDDNRIYPIAVEDDNDDQNVEEVRLNSLKNVQLRRRIKKEDVRCRHIYLAYLTSNRLHRRFVSTNFQVSTTSLISTLELVSKHQRPPPNVFGTGKNGRTKIQSTNDKKETEENLIETKLNKNDKNLSSSSTTPITTTITTTTTSNIGENEKTSQTTTTTITTTTTTSTMVFNPALLGARNVHSQLQLTQANNYNADGCTEIGDYSSSKLSITPTTTSTTISTAVSSSGGNDGQVIGMTTTKNIPQSQKQQPSNPLIIQAKLALSFNNSINNYVKVSHGEISNKLNKNDVTLPANQLDITMTDESSSNVVSTSCEMNEEQIQLEDDEDISEKNIFESVSQYQKLSNRVRDATKQLQNVYMQNWLAKNKSMSVENYEMDIDAMRRRLAKVEENRLRRYQSMILKTNQTDVNSIGSMSSIIIQSQLNNVHDFSLEQQSYFVDLTEPCVGQSEDKRSETLKTIQSDPCIIHLLPRLVTFIVDGIQLNCILKNMAVLIYLIRMVRSLVQNKYIVSAIHQYIDDIVPCCMNCALSFKVTCETYENHWILRKLACKALEEIVKNHATPENRLKYRIIKVIRKLLCDVEQPEVSVGSIYGCINLAHSFGIEISRKLILPVIEPIMVRINSIERTTDNSSDFVTVCDELAEIIVTIMRSDTLKICEYKNMSNEDFQRKMESKKRLGHYKTLFDVDHDYLVKKYGSFMGERIFRKIMAQKLISRDKSEQLKANALQLERSKKKNLVEIKPMMVTTVPTSNQRGISVPKADNVKFPSNYMKSTINKDQKSTHITNNMMNRNAMRNASRVNPMLKQTTSTCIPNKPAQESYTVSHVSAIRQEGNSIHVAKKMRSNNGGSIIDSQTHHHFMNNNEKNNFRNTNGPITTILPHKSVSDMAYESKQSIHVPFVPNFSQQNHHHNNNNGNSIPPPNIIQDDQITNNNENHQRHQFSNNFRQNNNNNNNVSRNESSSSISSASINSLSNFNSVNQYPNQPNGYNYAKKSFNNSNLNNNNND
ncbi:hypothetical protein SNEBB_002415 [Seison nebaliae]|nr:hypothetical protein SNEBB_002415 [Seison nebaliae]